MGHVLLWTLCVLAALSAGCYEGVSVQELEFPPTAAPGRSTKVLWSFDGIDPERIHRAELHWSVGSHALNQSVTASRSGEGPARPQTCGPDENCPRWTGHVFRGDLPPLEPGSWLLYQVRGWYGGTHVDSRTVRLEATPHPDSTSPP